MFGNIFGGIINSQGYNIDTNGTAVDKDFAPGFTAPGDQVGTFGTPINIQLDVLADNGGFSKTHALLAGSSAINPVGTTSANAPITDQRGLSRNSTPDIGAYESASILDLMDSQDYNGDDGSITWGAGNTWQEIGEATDATGGKVQVVVNPFDASDWSIEIEGGDGFGVSRQVDLSTATNAVLSFDWAMIDVDTGETIALEIRKGTDTWTTLETFVAPVANHSSMQASVPYDITAWIASDTQIRFVSSGFNGNDTFYLDNVRIDLSDLPPNTAPVATDDTGMVDEDATLTTNTITGVLNNDTDPDGNPMNITLIQHGATSVAAGNDIIGLYGTLNLNADGSYSYFADQDLADALATAESVTDTFTYTVSDSNGDTDTADLVITVTGTNDAPVIPLPTTVFINELHYDNASVDTGEFVELMGAAGTDLTGWSLEFYNGFDGTTYRTELLTGSITDQQDGFGTVRIDLPVDGIQNADSAADGMALVNDIGEVVQFISYEGVFTATNGAAVGLTSTDIGVAENASTPVGGSLQLTGSSSQFTWTVSTTSTPGDVNEGQYIYAFDTGIEDNPITYTFTDLMTLIVGSDVDSTSLTISCQ